MSIAERLGTQAEEVDSRYHLAAGMRRQINKVFPTHWSFLLGEIALYSFIVLLITGLNLLNVKVFGELEFWLSVVKVTAIILMIVGGFAILLFGFAVPSDVFSRYMRMAGHDVLMVSGSDEHGTPILVLADKEGVSPQDLVDHRLLRVEMVIQTPREDSGRVGDVPDRRRAQPLLGEHAPGGRQQLVPARRTSRRVGGTRSGPAVRVDPGLTSW